MARKRDRIAVDVPERAGSRQHRELGAFARYCILRVERELGERETWLVEVSPSVGGYTCVIAVSDRDRRFTERGIGFDGPLAIWEAMCRLEQRLREAPKR